MTDPGCVRSVNEDRVAVLAAPDLAPQPGTLLVVADGVGGHQGGAVASALVVDALERWFAAGGPSASHRADDPECLLAEAIRAANVAVHAAAAKQPELSGMASTVTAVVVVGERFFLGHVGDSRAYLAREGLIRQLSHDHSWVAEAVASRRIEPDEALTHPYKHVLTQAVGGMTSPRVETSTGDLRLDDVLLLCTDGLSTLVSDGEILRLAAGDHTPAEAARQLVQLAKGRGARDNVTVLVARARRSHV